MEHTFYMCCPNNSKYLQQMLNGADGKDCRCCRGFVRALGLSANQAIHVPEAGDFQIGKIEGPSRPQPWAGWRGKGENPSKPQVMDVEGVQLPVLAVADREGRESLQRENEPDPLDAEQTWPTKEVTHRRRLKIVVVTVLQVLSARQKAQ